MLIFAHDDRVALLLGHRHRADLGIEHAGLLRGHDLELAGQRHALSWAFIRLLMKRPSMLMSSTALLRLKASNATVHPDNGIRACQSGATSAAMARHKFQVHSPSSDSTAEMTDGPM